MGHAPNSTNHQKLQPQLVMKNTMLKSSSKTKPESTQSTPASTTTTTKTHSPNPPPPPSPPSLVSLLAQGTTLSPSALVHPPTNSPSSSTPAATSPGPNASHVLGLVTTRLSPSSTLLSPPHTKTSHVPPPRVLSSHPPASNTTAPPPTPPASMPPSFLFGCGLDNEGLFSGSAGLLGLGRSSISLVEQSANKYNRFFSYCLPSTSSSTGHLTFGDGGSPNGVKFTKLITSSQSESAASLYGLDLAGINVGGSQLSIAPSVFPSSGTIIDSGTVIKRLPATAYAVLRGAFQEAMKNYTLTMGDSLLDTCYDFSCLDTVSYSKIAFVFGDGLTVDLDACANCKTKPESTQSTPASTTESTTHSPNPPPPPSQPSPVSFWVQETTLSPSASARQPSNSPSSLIPVATSPGPNAAHVFDLVTDRASPSSTLLSLPHTKNYPVHPPRVLNSHLPSSNTVAPPPRPPAFTASGTETGPSPSGISPKKSLH
ncbi:unnamed protein product [Prunus armeniaca]|uniref:Peptidase A1 domain-containing protein n=1 Tax=Prunus armeniaca TaxID=36596 RepID=A0A6J5W9D7_PRUAR|nr:unnamed protein product [Prunus armeniaca]